LWFLPSYQLKYLADIGAHIASYPWLAWQLDNYTKNKNNNREKNKVALATSN
jgi:hypothetical protein